METLFPSWCCIIPLTAGVDNDGISPAAFCFAMLTMLSMLISVTSLALFHQTWLLTYVGPVFAHGTPIYSYHPFTAFTPRLGTMLNVHRVNHGLHLPFASRSVPRVLRKRLQSTMGFWFTSTLQNEQLPKRPKKCMVGGYKIVQVCTRRLTMINRWFMGHESFK